MNTGRMTNYLFSLLVILLALLSGCAQSPTGRNQLMLVSPESAIASSKQAYLQTLAPLSKEGKIDSDPVVTKRVQDITGRIIYQAIEAFPHTKDWEWSVKVIDEPEMVNAWCMAGGRMAIYTGLINKVKPSDDELAQVMGHEISHALANHTAERMSTAIASQIGILGVAVATRNNDNQGAIMVGTMAAAALAVNLPNSRAGESEADRMGIELAAKAGFDPFAAATLWQKMGAVGGSSPPQFLSTHPSPENRQEILGKLAEEVMPYYQKQEKHPVYQFKTDLGNK